MSESSSPVQTPTDSASPPAEVLPCTAWVRGGAVPLRMDLRTAPPENEHQQVILRAAFHALLGRAALFPVVQGRFEAHAFEAVATSPEWTGREAAYAEVELFARPGPGVTLRWAIRVGRPTVVGLSWPFAAAYVLGANGFYPEPDPSAKGTADPHATRTTLCERVGAFHPSAEAALSALVPWGSVTGVPSTPWPTAAQVLSAQSFWLQAAARKVGFSPILLRAFEGTRFDGTRVLRWALETLVAGVWHAFDPRPRTAQESSGHWVSREMGTLPCFASGPEALGVLGAAELGAPPLWIPRFGLAPAPEERFHPPAPVPPTPATEAAREMFEGLFRAQVNALAALTAPAWVEAPRADLREWFVALAARAYPIETVRTRLNSITVPLSLIGRVPADEQSSRIADVHLALVFASGAESDGTFRWGVVLETPWDLRIPVDGGWCRICGERLAAFVRSSGNDDPSVLLSGLPGIGGFFSGDVVRIPVTSGAGSLCLVGTWPPGERRGSLWKLMSGDWTWDPRTRCWATDVTPWAASGPEALGWVAEALRASPTQASPDAADDDGRGPATADAFADRFLAQGAELLMAGRAHLLGLLHAAGLAPLAAPLERCPAPGDQGYLLEDLQARLVNLGLLDGPPASGATLAPCYGPHADPPQVTRFDPHAAQLPGVLDTLRRLAQLLSDAESALRPRAPFSLSHHDRT